MTVQVNGPLIKDLRLKRSLSQERLAEIVGVNLRTIQRVEIRGAASLSTRAALATAFGVKPEDLDPPKDLSLEPATDDAASSAEPVTHPARWLLLSLSMALILFGTGVLTFTVNRVFSLGYLAVSSLGGSLSVLIGFVLLAPLTTLSRWRAHVIFVVVALTLTASPRVLTAQLLLGIPLWAAFELSVLARKSGLPERLASWQSRA